jgi:hypothetical protein
LFQLCLREAGFEALIGGIARLHIGGSWLSTLLRCQSRFPYSHNCLSSRLEFTS